MSEIMKVCINGIAQKVRNLLKAQEFKNVKVFYNDGNDEESEIVNAKTIANNLSKYYGKYVKYNAPNGCNVKWQILYADKTNIYLITDDYVSKEYMPCGRKGSKIYVNGNDYNLSFDNVIYDYEGSMDINKKLKFLNSKYFGALVEKSSNNISIKAVAYMLDINAWKGFAKEQVNYAIGGPTLELLIKAHNKLYPTQQIDYSADIYGYKIRRHGSSNWSFSLLNAFDACENTSYIANTSKAYGMWVASPSTDYYDHLIRVPNNATLDRDYYGSSCLGFRPLVSLKSSVTLKKVGNEFEIL